MIHKYHIKDLFESIPDYRKNVILLFLIKDDVVILHEYGFPKDDINHLCSELKNFLVEQNDEHLEYIRDKVE